jgi:hypothetical protein
VHIPSFRRLNWKQELRNILTESKIATKLNLKLECHYIIIIGYGTIVSLWRYLVESMMGEELNSLYVTERGTLRGSHIRTNRPENWQGG